MSDGMTDKRSQPDEPTGWTDKHEAAARAAIDDGRASLRAGIAAATAEVAKRGNQLHPKVAAMRKSKAVDQARLEALRLAVQIGGHANNVMEAASRFLNFLDPASVTHLTLKEPLPADVVAGLQASLGRLEPAIDAAPPESLMGRLDRHAKVIQVAFPRVSVSFSEALHIADAIRLDDARINGEHADRLKQEASAPQSSAEPELPPYLAAEVGDVVEIQFTGGSPMAGVVTGVGARDDTHRLAVRYGDHNGWIPNECIKRIVRKASETGK